MSFGGTLKHERSKAFTKVPAPTIAQHRSRLLNLPSELRNRIYHFALQITIPCKLRKTIKCPRLHPIKPPAPGLIRACCQTYAEAIRMLYQQARYTFDNVDLLSSWLKKTGAERLQLVPFLYLKTTISDFKPFIASYWAPRWSLKMYALEAQAALEVVKTELELGDVVLRNDVYMPGRMLEVLWTGRPIAVVKEFLENVDDSVLGRQTWQAFEMLRRDREEVWA